MRTPTSAPALRLVCFAAAAGCGSSDSRSTAIDVATPDADRCEILDPNECLLPFPSDALTVEDGSTDTGRRVHFALESMPADAGGVRVDPTEWNRNDGFSPGAQIAVLGADPGLGVPPHRRRPGRRLRRRGVHDARMSPAP